jgi:8-amino-7-oxononanoate synthase
MTTFNKVDEPMEQVDPLAWIEDELQAWDNLGLRRRRIAREGRQGPRICIGGQSLINFGSNDYLGLAGEALASAILKSVGESGWGSGASPLVTGRATLHARLEEALAEFEGVPAALLFSSGYSANCGVIATLAGKGDVIFSDAKNHASIIDGCRLSGARIVVYPHNDPAYVEMMLKQATNFRRRLIVTDGLFSMDGDLAPLRELGDLAQRYGAMLMVDEAHASGVFGALGRGVSEFLGVEDRVSVRIGTLSKAFGSIGGFVAGSLPLIEWTSNRARTYVFSTMLPEAAAAAALQSLEIVRGEPQRRSELLARAEALRSRIRQLGWNVGCSASQIIPIYIGAPDEVVKLAAALRDRGLFVPAIRPPTVPDGESLLRISLTHAHSDSMLEELVTALEEIRRG